MPYGCQWRGCLFRRRVEVGVDFSLLCAPDKVREYCDTWYDIYELVIGCGVVGRVSTRG